MVAKLDYSLHCVSYRPTNSAYVCAETIGPEVGPTAKVAFPTATKLVTTVGKTTRRQCWFNYEAVLSQHVQSVGRGWESYFWPSFLGSSFVVCVERSKPSKLIRVRMKSILLRHTIHKLRLIWFDVDLPYFFENWPIDRHVQSSWILYLKVGTSKAAKYCRSRIDLLPTPSNYHQYAWRTKSCYSSLSTLLTGPMASVLSTSRTSISPDCQLTIHTLQYTM